MELREQVEAIRSQEDFVSFIRALRGKLESDANAWEDLSLDRYLEALAAWVEDRAGYQEHVGHPWPEQPTWQLVGQALFAAAIYE